MKMITLILATMILASNISSAGESSVREEKLVSRFVTALSNDDISTSKLDILNERLLNAVKDGKFESNVLALISKTYIAASNAGDARLANSLASAMIEYSPEIFVDVETKNEQYLVNNSKLKMNVMDPGESATSYGEAIQQTPGGYGFAGRTVEHGYNEARREYPAATNFGIAAGAAALTGSSAGASVVWGAANAMSGSQPAPSTELQLDQ